MELKQNKLTGFTEMEGDEQGTILPGAKDALASSCAGPQGRFFGTIGKSIPGKPELKKSAYDPPLKKLPCEYYFLRNYGPARSRCTVFIQDIANCRDLDWFGYALIRANPC